MNGQSRTADEGFNHQVGGRSYDLKVRGGMMHGQHCLMKGTVLVTARETA